MKNKQIVFMDGFDKVIDQATQQIVFKTKTKFADCNCTVIDNVVDIWNSTQSTEKVDTYLLDEPLCQQEDREHIVESLFQFHHGEAAKLAEMAKEMAIENLEIFCKSLEVLADENVPRQDKNESLYVFLQTKVLGKTFQEWHSIVNGEMSIDFQMIHNGKDQIKLFNFVYEKFKVLFEQVAQHIFDNWVVQESNGRTVVPYFASEYNKPNFMVNDFALLVDGFNLAVSYKEYSPSTAASKHQMLGIHFVIE